MTQMPPPPDPRRPPSSGGLEPPTFSLASLWCAVTILCGVFALLAAVGPVWATGLVFLALLAAGHVLGNVLGTRLRSPSDRSSADRNRTAAGLSHAAEGHGHE